MQAHVMLSLGKSFAEATRYNVTAATVSSSTTPNSCSCYECIASIARDSCCCRANFEVPFKFDRSCDWSCIWRQAWRICSPPLAELHSLQRQQAYHWQGTTGTDALVTQCNTTCWASLVPLTKGIFGLWLCQTYWQYTTTKFFVSMRSDTAP